MAITLPGRPGTLTPVRPSAFTTTMPSGLTIPASSIAQISPPDPGTMVQTANGTYHAPTPSAAQPANIIPAGYGNEPTPTIAKAPNGAIANIGGSTTPATPAAPAPASPAAPTLTPEQINAQAQAQVAGDMQAGTAYANSVLPDNTLARLGTDADIKAYLSNLQSRQSGMTPEELRAEYEQGTANSNGVLATNLRRAGQIAGSAGVRGGAAAGMQMQALNQSINDQAALQRQMVLDNVAQKNNAFAAYGTNLMGVKQYDAGETDKEKLGRLSAGTEYGGLIDSARTGINANITAADITQMAKDHSKSLDAAGQGGSTTPAAEPAAGTPAAVAADNAAIAAADKTVNTAITPITDMIKNSRSPTNRKDGAPELDEDVVKQKLTAIIDENYPMLTQAEKDKKLRALWTQTHKDAGWSDVDMASNISPPGSAVICTEALHQKLITPETYAQLERGRPPGFFHDDIAAYHTWGIPAATLMRKHQLFARFIAWGLPATLNRLYSRPDTRIRGMIGAAVFRTLNTIIKASRYCRMERA